MNPGWKELFIALTGAAGVVAAVLGCGKLDPRSQIAANQPPVITLGRPTLESGSEESRLAVTWTAHDPDGRIDHYVYALDPARVDRVDAKWTLSHESGAVARFARHTAIGRLAADTRSDERHLFAVRAVDDRGAMSEPAVVGVVGDNITPIVYIQSPQPNAVFTPIVPPSLTIQWAGNDPDGQVVKYKYRLFTQHNPDFPNVIDFVSFIVANPTFLNDVYGPTFGPSSKCPTCTSWDSVDASMTSVHYSNLVANEKYLFAITAFDNSGDYDPVFSPSSNLLQFFVSTNQNANPQITVSSTIFTYSQSVGGDVDVSYQIPGSLALPVQWFAVPAIGGQIAGYRWVLDPLDPTDEKTRTNPTSDPNHWTPWSLANTTATVGPFTTPPGLQSEHVLYIEAKDDFDRISTVRIHFAVVSPSYDRQLLIVDDTRLTPDQIDPVSGTLKPPAGTWPTAAELDTFLYARGGVPWRGYPAGTTSTPGLLAGYDFDTLGTRGIPGGIVPLSTLMRYRHVIWFTDGTGATFTGPPEEMLQPITSLRLMSSPGQYSTISAYVRQGGGLWMSGGGSAYATLVAWGKRNTPSDDWTNVDQELVPGRFMYDFAHWQSCVAVRPGRRALINTPDFAPWDNAAMGRGWSGQGMDHTLTQPNYSKLAADPVMSVLVGRTCASDPPPPLRLCNSFYLVLSYDAEYIGRNPAFGPIPNFVREDVDSRPNHDELASTLDTLYTVAGGSVPGVLPVMTYYHGFESGPVVFSGFPVWFFQKQQAAKLTDFVLQDIWGLSKDGGQSILTTAPLVRQKGVISATALNRKTGPLAPAATPTRPR